MRAELDQNETPASVVHRAPEAQKITWCRSASVAIRATLETCDRSRCEVSGQMKNQLAQSVCRILCGEEITLQAAQAIFLAPDWRSEYQRFFKPEK
jgi:hypothetical protein